MKIWISKKCDKYFLIRENHSKIKKSELFGVSGQAYEITIVTVKHVQLCFKLVVKFNS